MNPFISSQSFAFRPTASTSNPTVPSVETMAESGGGVNSPALISATQPTEALPLLPIGLGQGSALAEGISPLASNYWQPMPQAMKQPPVESTDEISVYDDVVIHTITTDPALEEKVHARLQDIDDSLTNTMERLNPSDATITDTLVALKEESESLTGKIEKILFFQTHQPC